MLLSERKHKVTGDPYYLISYEDDDVGFYLLRMEEGTFFPTAVLVLPRPNGWLARINWADWDHSKHDTIFHETFHVSGKTITPVENQGTREVEVTPIHHGLWKHCIGLIKKQETKVSEQHAATNPALIRIPPVWQVWHKPTIAEMDEWGEKLL